MRGCAGGHVAVTLNASGCASHGGFARVGGCAGSHVAVTVSAIDAVLVMVLYVFVDCASDKIRNLNLVFQRVCLDLSDRAFLNNVSSLC